MADSDTPEIDSKSIRVWDAENDERFERLEDVRGREAALEGVAHRTPKQEVGLRDARIQRKAIEDEILTANRGFAINYAQHFLRGTKPELAEDYTAIATEALFDAIRQYDRTRGPFPPWAKIFLKRDILDAVRRQEYPSIPHQDFAARQIVMDAFHRMSMQRQSGQVSPVEVAASAGFPLAVVMRILTARPIESLEALDEENLDQVLFDDDEKLFGRVTDDIDELFLEYLKRATQCLEMQELLVVLLYNGLTGWPPITFQEIATHLGLGREAVRRRYERAKTKVEESGYTIPTALD
jgi:RNA polymerase sigma factor (sigma-70 family)